MRWAIAAVLALAVPAVADKPKAKPTAKTEAKPAQACKMKYVGKGLERKAICVFEKDIVITSGPSKPAVVIAPIDGRKVTGRPKLTDPLAGLSRRRETAK